jgi:hypothetical protein
MAKPSITKRSTKGAALTYSELDTNFDNLKDATLTLTAGSGGTAVISDLNGNITIVAGSGITLAGDNSAKTITITSTGGGGGGNSFTTIAVTGQSDVVADSATDTLSLAAGSGITLTTNATTDTITISGSANTFSTIAVAGQSNVVADSTSDTLTLVAGSGITLTTNSSSDSVTIAASSSRTSNLDMNSYGIVDSTTDHVSINEKELWIGSGATAGSATITTIAGFYNNLILRTNQPGVDSSSSITINESLVGNSIITIATVSNGDIQLSPNGSGKVKISSNIELGTGGAVIAYDSGASKVTFDKAIQTSNLKITTNEIQAMNLNGDIRLSPDGTGKVYLAGALKTDSTSGTPSNTSTINSWLKITVGGSDYYLALYQ